MNKLYFVVLSALLCGCAHQVNCSFANMDDDFLVVSVMDSTYRNVATIDTIKGKNGKFSFDIKGDGLKAIRITSTSNNSKEGINTFIYPNWKLDISGTFENPVLGGNQFYEDMTVIDKYEARIMQKRNEMFNEMKLLEQQGFDPDSLFLVKKELNKVLLDSVSYFNTKFVKEHPDNDASAFLTTRLNINSIELIGEKVRNGPFAEYLKSKIAERKKAQEEIGKIMIDTPLDGQVAPLFSMKDANGKVFTLSSFRGKKYVMLDFWGTWCTWCIAGFPDMKKSYEKYGDKIEFVSICHSDTEAMWRKALKRYDIPWINLLNDEKNNNLVELYAITGAPQKIIIDMNGVVLKSFYGETQEFYIFLKELFGDI